MPQVTIDQAMQIAMQHHQAGRLQEAEQLYRQVLTQFPSHAPAIHNLGLIAHQGGRADLAIDLIGRAIALKPDDADAQYNLGNALRDSGQLDEANAAYRRAIALNPRFIEAHNNLGDSLRRQGRIDEAIAAYRLAIALYANSAEAHCNLGIALAEKGQLDGAITAYRRAIAVRPDLPAVQYNLGNALRDKGEVDEAVAAYRRAIALLPTYAEAYSNLGNALTDQGKVDEALWAYAKATALKPSAADFHSNTVYAVCLHPDYDSQRILHEAKTWARLHADPLAVHLRPHDNDRSPDRRIRVGYVSPDFRDHVVGRNVLPLLQGHDREHVEVFCYANQVERPNDPLTSQFRECDNAWRNIVAMSDEQVAELVRADGIDILVDLALHTAHNRLLVFARKPAPVQVTWAGYPGTTGLSTIDYRLSDPYLDPFDSAQGPGNSRRVGVPAHHFASTVGEYAHPTNESTSSEGQGPECRGDAFYSETSIRLPHSFWCFRRTSGTPEVNPLPALSNGYVAFGCLNNFCKVSAAALDLWEQVLRSVDNSRLLILSPSGSHRGEVVRRFQAGGVDASRIEFVSPVPFADYMRLYHLIDIGLDPLPYTGHSTSLDSFWMGVPVVTLAGGTVASPGGVSIASNLGMPELIAQTWLQYVGIAKGLADDLTSLGEARSTLRERMQGSPLMDERQFTSDIERAYRKMWRTWCDSRGRQ